MDNLKATSPSPETLMFLCLLEAVSREVSVGRLPVLVNRARSQWWGRRARDQLQVSLGSVFERRSSSQPVVGRRSWCQSESWRTEQGRGEALGGKPEGYVETTAEKRGDVETTARESLPAPRRSRVLIRALTR